MSSAVATRRATLADLYRVEGKAELIGGRIVPIMPTGDWPNLIGGEIFASLRFFAKARKKGRAHTDGVGYAVPILPSGRESFSPDASFFEGKTPAKNMRFISGAPLFAAEVRSENDYGDAAELRLTAKRDDYFAAGTQVVWDVDPKAEVVRAYHASEPINPRVFRKGEVADAEPALPGWRMPVDEIFGE